MLTGKFKRNEHPDDTSSRVGYMASMKKKGGYTTANWDEFTDNENYWKLIDLMQQVAKNHGNFEVQIYQKRIKRCF